MMHTGEECSYQYREREYQRVDQEGARRIGDCH